MERWSFLFSAVSSLIVYFLMTTRAVCPNINPTTLCAHVCDVNYAVCYYRPTHPLPTRPVSSLFPGFSSTRPTRAGVGENPGNEVGAV